MTPATYTAGPRSAYKLRPYRRLDTLRNVRTRRHPSPIMRARGSRQVPVWAVDLAVVRRRRARARRRDAAMASAARKYAAAVGMTVPDPLTPAMAETVIVLAVLAATDPDRFRRELARLRFLARLDPGRPTP